MTDAQTHNDALALVMPSSARTVALPAMLPPKTAFSSAGRPGDCQVLLYPSPARIRMGRKVSTFAPTVLPRSP
jgi:hypothetical protein